MELKIESATERPLLKRRHIVAQLSFPGEKTPSNKEVIGAIAKATSASDDAVAVRRIDAVFGSTMAHVDAYVYQNKEALAKTEARHKDKTAKPAAGAEPAEEKK